MMESGEKAFAFVSYVHAVNFILIMFIVNYSLCWLPSLLPLFVVFIGQFVLCIILQSKVIRYDTITLVPLKMQLLVLKG